MRMRGIGFAAAIGAAALAAAIAGAAGTAKTVERDFDSDTAGGAPAFFRFEGTPGLPPESWKAIPDAQAFSRPNVAVQTIATGEPAHFHFALSTQAGSFADGSVQALAKRAGFKGFARGGVVARYQNPGNFVAALVDFQSQTVTALSMHDGKAAALGQGPIRSNEPVWRTVRLEVSGKTIRVSVSGRVTIETEDPSPHSGAGGLVAEAPVPVAFDDLTIETR